MRALQNRSIRIVSWAALVLALAAGLWPLIHGSSLRAGTVRMTARLLAAFSHPKPYQADVFIPIRFDAQDHALSCEFAALKMAFAYRGLEVSENELLARTGADRSPRSWRGGQSYWGDPDEVFVGDIDGKIMRTGYGVHWPALERVARTYRNVVGFDGWGMADLGRELAGGNPVVVWGCLGPCTPATWRTATGYQVSAVNYEHAFVANGLMGNPEHPDGIFLMDPIYGQKYLPSGDFERMWSTLGYSGIVVY